MADVRAMCAIGQRGQLGLGGQMPWEGATGPEYKADVARFWKATRGHVVLAGPRTYCSIPEFAHAERTIVELRSYMDPHETIARFADRIIFIGGGPPVWDVYAPLIQHWDITRLPYDGDADRWFNPAWVISAKSA
jgi:dihydromethanopterin reductase